MLKYSTKANFEEVSKFHCNNSIWGKPLLSCLHEFSSICIVNSQNTFDIYSLKVWLSNYVITLIFMDVIKVWWSNCIICSAKFLKHSHKSAEKFNKRICDKMLEKNESKGKFVFCFCERIENEIGKSFQLRWTLFSFDEIS